MNWKRYGITLAFLLVGQYIAGTYLLNHVIVAFYGGVVVSITRDIVVEVLD